MAGGVERILRFSLTSGNAESLRRFYEAAFDCRCIARRRHPDAASLALRLGDDEVELLQFDSPGRPYPANHTSADADFQHLALVVADMNRAYERLHSVRGWTPISTHGPQQLPESSGGVTAFKFRDPEGHPLELLAFPHGRVPAQWRANPRGLLFLGVDHSAICVRATAASIAFYNLLALRVGAQTLNEGPEQACLDGLDRPVAQVTSLTLALPGPHLELLSYQTALQARGPATANNDLAATRTVFEARPVTPSQRGQIERLTDPDGHHLQIVYTATE